MKKKALMTILLLCVTMAMTACGGNAETTKDTETTATEESTEVETQTETEDETPTEEDTEDAEPEPTEEPVEEVIQYEFGEVVEHALEQDKSADYGVNSTSSYDVAQFIKDGQPEWTIDTDYSNPEYSEFTGRFAYPEITPSELFDSAIIRDRTDNSQDISVWNTANEENGLTVTMRPGAWYYNDSSSVVGSIPTYSIPFSIGTIDGSCEVVLVCNQIMSYPDWVQYNENGDCIDSEGNVLEYDEEYNLLDKDGNIIEMVDKGLVSIYIYKLGDFTIDVSGLNFELTQEQMQTIADSIHLVGGEAE